jgi:hypothetical protein
MDDSLIQKFGFSEMYEWENIPAPNNRLARLVCFSKKNPEKIVLYGEEKGANHIVGVTTICSIIDSDNPDEWKYAYLCNEYGDIYLQKERLAVGEKIYDQVNEINYIKTRPWEHFIRIPNKSYDDKKQYVKRSNRQEWVRVNLMGKVIIEDNGKCIPGGYCKPYEGKLIENFGTVVPVEENEQVKEGTPTYYVLTRITEKTIIILNK